ncbi:MAG: hypothetical protein Ct9H300mP7_3910 [Verrucomicrobiota bacterium]|nr:MAG: hypothetical protein Ct9H300mP7_3910 [Verrucomicrobiota bacterium]
MKWVADPNLAQGGDHVNFSLASLGEPIALYSRTKSLVDKHEISKTTLGESEGRCPTAPCRSPNFPTHPLLENPTICRSKRGHNEVLLILIPPSKTPSSFETSPPSPSILELVDSNSNQTGTNSRFRQYYFVRSRRDGPFFEAQFNPAPGADHSFALNSAHGTRSLSLKRIVPDN